MVRWWYEKKILYIISLLLIVLLAVNIGILIYLNSSTVRVKNQLELAQRYLTDMEYVEAIAASEAIIHEYDENNKELRCNIYLQDAFIND